MLILGLLTDPLANMVKIPADPVVPPAGCVVSSTESIVPPDPVAPPTSPVVPHAGPSTSIEKAQVIKLLELDILLPRRRR